MGLDADGRGGAVVVVVAVVARGRMRMDGLTLASERVGGLVKMELLRVIAGLGVLPLWPSYLTWPIWPQGT
jgi:hypothetical protein